MQSHFRRLSRIWVAPPGSTPRRPVYRAIFGDIAPQFYHDCYAFRGGFRKLQNPATNLRLDLNSLARSGYLTPLGLRVAPNYLVGSRLVGPPVACELHITFQSTLPPQRVTPLLAGTLHDTVYKTYGALKPPVLKDTWKGQRSLEWWEYDDMPVPQTPEWYKESYPVPV